MLTETETPIQMRLYASGNNAWNQLVFSSPLSRAGDGTDSATDEPEDWNSFALMLGPESRLELVTAQVSYTLGMCKRKKQKKIIKKYKNAFLVTKIHAKLLLPHSYLICCPVSYMRLHCY